MRGLSVSAYVLPSALRRSTWKHFADVSKGHGHLTHSVLCCNTDGKQKTRAIKVSLHFLRLWVTTDMWVQLSVSSPGNNGELKRRTAMRENMTQHAQRHSSHSQLSGKLIHFSVGAKESDRNRLWKLSGNLFPTICCIFVNFLGWLVTWTGSQQFQRLFLFFQSSDYDRKAGNFSWMIFCTRSLHVFTIYFFFSDTKISED